MLPTKNKGNTISIWFFTKKQKPPFRVAFENERDIVYFLITLTVFVAFAVATLIK